MDVTLVVVFFCLVSVSAGIHVEILKPNTTVGPEAALLIVPGASISEIAYTPLAKAIQKRSEFKLWIALLGGFFEKSANPLQLPSAFSKARKELKSAGYDGENVFIAGHSLGGAVTAEFGQKASEPLEGVLLFSAYITKEHTLKDYPFPVLTISGDLDGLTRTTRILDTFVELQRDVATDVDQKYVTPVVVMEGVNHGQFASGTLPKAVTNHDLNPEVSQEVAYDTIANFTNAFMVYTRNDTNSTNIKDATLVLDKAYSDVAAMMKPLNDIKSLDQNDQWVSQWTNTAQQLKVSLKNKTGVQFVNYEDESESYHAVGRSTILPPRQNITQIISFTTLWVDPNPADVTTEPQSPLQLKATMRSQEAIRKLFPARPFGTPATCKEINQDAFTLAYSKASKKAQSRYSSRGRPVTFNDDKEVTANLLWIFAKLDLNYSTTGLTVTATRYSQPASSKEDSGHDDCTLLSPFRAMEWIYIDSLKYTKP